MDPVAFSSWGRLLRQPRMLGGRVEIVISSCLLAVLRARESLGGWQENSSDPISWMYRCWMVVDGWDAAFAHWP
jgi:hypothetical protein